MSGVYGTSRHGRVRLGLISSLACLSLVAFGCGWCLFVKQSPWAVAQQVWNTTLHPAPATPRPPVTIADAVPEPAEISEALRAELTPLTTSMLVPPVVIGDEDNDFTPETLSISAPAEVFVAPAGESAPEEQEVPQSVIVPIADERPARTNKKNKATAPAQTASTEKAPVKPQPLVEPARSGAIDLTQVEQFLAEGNEMMAYQLLSEWYFKFPGERKRFQTQLDELATRIYFTPQPHIEPPYEIQPGDELRKIARKYQLSWQYLARVNQVDPKKIRAGKKLKVFQGPFGAVVDMSDFELTVHLNGQYVRRYHVGLGKNNSTPTGEFTVKDKLENPKYYGSDGEVREPDDPLNPLGERWVDLGDSYGIHGTIHPESIGKSESKGCVRMLNDDVAEVYDLLSVGSPVRIQR